ncbi:hypothetical protein LXL04_033570 [Taraxacum kok-saghyz]
MRSRTKQNNSETDQAIELNTANISTEQLLHDVSGINVGPVRAFKVMKQTQGGFENVGSSAVECKNFKRDLILLIGEGGVDLVIEKLSKKMENSPDYTFEYYEDKHEMLSGLFWADEEGKRNYMPFGDAVEFDAIYRTNKSNNYVCCLHKYMMVFFPFTGIDNHKKYVTFAAGLLCSETKEAYQWLLTCFKNTFGSSSEGSDSRSVFQYCKTSVLYVAHIPKIYKKLGTQLSKTDVLN